MSKIRFDANVPVEVALKFEAGKRVPSTLKDKDGNPLPDQVFYTLCGDDTMYVSLSVAEQIQKLGIRKMELFSICKTVRNQVTRWLVQRVGDTTTTAINNEPPAPNWDEMPSDLEATLEASVRLQQQRNALTPSKSVASAVAVATMPQTLSKPTAQSHTQQNNSTVPTQASYAMASALIASVDALILAQQYAASKGMMLNFNEEDVRATAATLYIQASKDPLFTERAAQKVNGGTTWPRQ